MSTQTHRQNINKTADMTKMALMVAMNCISAYIIIPLPFSMSPIALQTLIVNLTGYLLTAKQAFITMLVYLLIGLLACLSSPAAPAARASCLVLPVVICLAFW